MHTYMISLLVSVSINPYYLFISRLIFCPFSLNICVVMLYCLKFIHSFVNRLTGIFLFFSHPVRYRTAVLYFHVCLSFEQNWSNAEIKLKQIDVLYQPSHIWTYNTTTNTLKQPRNVILSVSLMFSVFFLYVFVGLSIPLATVRFLVPRLQTLYCQFLLLNDNYVLFVGNKLPVLTYLLTCSVCVFPVVVEPLSLCDELCDNLTGSPTVWCTFRWLSTSVHFAATSTWTRWLPALSTSPLRCCPSNWWTGNRSDVGGRQVWACSALRSSASAAFRRYSAVGILQRVTKKFHWFNVE